MGLLVEAKIGYRCYAMSLERRLSKVSRDWIYGLLERYWGLRGGGDVRVVVRWRAQREMVGGALGVTVYVGRRRGVMLFRVDISERAAEGEGIWKGVCAHEALHIAYTYCQLVEDMDRFWAGVGEMVADGLERLRRDYGSAEEFVVCVLEPLAALYFCPPPLRNRDEAPWYVEFPSSDD